MCLQVENLQHSSPACTLSASQLWSTSCCGYCVVLLLPCCVALWSSSCLVVIELPCGHRVALWSSSCLVIIVLPCVHRVALWSSSCLVVIVLPCGHRVALWSLCCLVIIELPCVCRVASWSTKKLILFSVDVKCVFNLTLESLRLWWTLGLCDISYITSAQQDAVQISLTAVT